MMLRRLPGDDVVGPLCLLDFKDMRDQRLHIHASVLQQSDERRHVPVLGPADVAVRVIVTCLLVGRVVAARPIGAGDLELELLLVEVRFARNVHGHRAHDDDHTLLPQDCDGQLHRIRRLSGGRDDDRVEPMPSREGCKG